MKTWIKRMLFMLVLSLTMLGCMGSKAAAAEDGTTEAVVIRDTIQLDENALPDNEELFAGYVEKVLYEDLYGNIAVFGNLGESRLKTEESKIVYRALKAKVAEVAAGNIESTDFYFTECLSWTASELGVSQITSANVQSLAENKYAEVIDMGAIIDCLRKDCPYDLYWYDKTNYTMSGYGCTYWSTKLSLNIVVQMPVAEEYLGSGESVYQINTELAKSVGNVKTKAASIVAENSGASDYEKMLAYKTAICDLVSYNYSVVGEDADVPYGNPWQLIWVFDEDESTKVVCEGYSKAFQYLCDLSGLTCYTVTGNLSYGTGAGAHMWNIVTLDGKNYLVDLTNCDVGTVGYPDKLFLAGTNGSVAAGYNFSLAYDILFTYKEEDISLLGEEILTLASAKYEEPKEITVPVTETFSDVKQGEWYVDSIQYVYDNGIMSGNSGLFNPTGNVTRVQVASTLYRLAGSPAVTDYRACDELVDVLRGQWYTDAVCWAYSTNVGTGNSTTKKFNVDSLVTRQQLASFFYRYAQYKGIDTTAYGDISGLLNCDKVESYAETAVKWAVGAGIISGSKVVGEGGSIQYDLNPTGTATRAQLASILMRFSEANNI